MQAICYYHSCARDHAFMRSLVGIVWFLDTAHAVILFRAIYQCLVYDFGRAVALDLARVMGELPPRIIVTILVQGFCFWRVWRLYRSIIPIGIFVVTSLIQIACTVVYMKGTFQVMQTPQTMLSVKISGYVYLAAVALADFTMASMLTALLYKQYRNTPIQKTSEMIWRLCLFSVNTGTWTAVFAVVAIVLSEHPRDTYYWAIFDVGVCGIYSNTLLANLNGRNYVVGDPSITLSFYQSTDMESRPRSNFRARHINEYESSQQSDAVEEGSIFQAAKRSQVSDV